MDFFKENNNIMYEWDTLPIIFLKTGDIKKKKKKIGNYKLLETHKLECIIDKKKYLLDFNSDYSEFKCKTLNNNSHRRILLNIYQNGKDGFGHQLEGTIRLISQHLNNTIYYNYNYNKQYKFQHSNFDKERLIGYFKTANNILATIPTNNFLVEKNILGKDGIGLGYKLPNNFENTENKLKRNIPHLRDIFVIKNHFLNKPTYDIKKHNISIHIRLGDAVGTRTLDTRIIGCVDIFSKLYPDSLIHIFSDEPEKIKFKKTENTYLYEKKMDVLDILSNMIHANILVLSYSGLSIAAHLLGEESQIVYVPDKAGVTFEHRILSKCKKISTIY